EPVGDAARAAHDAVRSGSGFHRTQVSSSVEARGGAVTTPSHVVHSLCTLAGRDARETARVSTIRAPVPPTVLPAAPVRREIVFDIDRLSVSYGPALAVKDVSLEIYQNAITALIGPSGCGKSTFLRCLNRMNDLVPSAKVEGRLVYHGIDLYGPGVDPIEVRRRIGMVFQRPNPFPKSI